MTDEYAIDDGRVELADGSVVELRGGRAWVRDAGGTHWHPPAAPHEPQLDARFSADEKAELERLKLSYSPWRDWFTRLEYAHLALWRWERRR